MRDKIKYRCINFIRTVLGVSATAALLLPLTAAAQDTQVEVQAALNKDSIYIGDIVTYTIAVKAPGNIDVRPQSAQLENISPLVVKNFSRKEKPEKNKTKIIILDYLLTGFDPGEFVIPGYVLEYRPKEQQQWQTLTSKEVKLSIKSVLDANEKMPNIKPLKPKVMVWSWLWRLGLILLAGLVCAGIFFLIKRYKEIKQAPEPKIPAHIIAYKELSELEGQRLPERGFMEEYFEKLSGCVRRYLENRFQFRAPLMSTEEFLAQAKESTVLSREHKQLLKDFLVLSDLVKFARYGSSLKEARGAFLAAKNFVEQTKEPEEPLEDEKKDKQ